MVRVNYRERRLFARYMYVSAIRDISFQIHVCMRDVSGEEPTFEVINFLSKNLRFSYTKDFCSLHIHGLYLYITPSVLLQIKTYEEQRKPTQIFTNCAYSLCVECICSRTRLYCLVRNIRWRRRRRTTQWNAMPNALRRHLKYSIINNG